MREKETRMVDNNVGASVSASASARVRGIRVVCVCVCINPVQVRMQDGWDGLLASVRRVWDIIPMVAWEHPTNNP